MYLNVYIKTLLMLNEIFRYVYCTINYINCSNSTIESFIKFEDRREFSYTWLVDLKTSIFSSPVINFV